MNQAKNWICGWLPIVLAGCILPALAEVDVVPGRAIVTQTILSAEADATAGRKSALQYCQACHLFT